VVTIVATFSAAMLWRQWRITEVEAAERARMQSAWVLIGALDWSRLILREDGRTAGADHLAEPWAVPLEEAKLTTFLAADKNVASDELEGLPDAFLSGQILDAQAKLNIRNLVEAGQPVESAVAAFQRLFELLGLPTQDVSLLIEGLRRASPNAGMVSGSHAEGGSVSVTQLAASEGGGSVPLMPQRVADLVWFGLQPSTVSAIEPYATLLPTATALNINTASPEALYASVPGLDMADARRLVFERQRHYFESLAQAGEIVQQTGAQFVSGQHGVATQYFEVRGRIRIDTTWVEEQSLLLRNGINVSVVWRQRGSGRTEAAQKGNLARS
jgi:general secretion pathway protein K